MHSDKKYLVMTGNESEFEILTPQSYSTGGFGPSETISSLSTALGTTNSEFSKTPTSVWINTVPMSTSSNTLGKRSNRSKRVMNANVFVKDYIKKRNLILELLAVEIEMLLVSFNFILYILFLIFSTLFYNILNYRFGEILVEDKNLHFLVNRVLQNGALRV